MSGPKIQSGNKRITAVAPIVLFLMLAFGSIQLKTSGLVGEASLVTLLIMSGVFGLAVFYGERLKKIGPSGLELHEAIKEVKNSESAVKELSLAMLDVLDAKDHGLILESYDRQAYEQAVEKVKKLAL